MQIAFNECKTFFFACIRNLLGMRNFQRQTYRTLLDGDQLYRLHRSTPQSLCYYRFAEVMKIEEIALEIEIAPKIDYFEINFDIDMEMQYEVPSAAIDKYYMHK